MPKPYFDIQQFGEQTDIYIFGDIVRYAYEDSQDTSAYSLVQQLKKNPDAAEINLHIDSFGGNVSEGWAIYNALKDSRARVTSYADGFVASAAIYPFLAGQERIASNVSAFYFHPASQFTGGYAEDLRNAADALDQLTEIGLGAFTNAGMEEQAARDLVNSKAWYSPADMLEKGIATSIRKTGDVSGVSQSVRGLIVQQLMVPPKNGQPPAEPPAKRSLMQMLYNI
jgi:ATP-dependent Clp protease, protease subunit